MPSFTDFAFLAPLVFLFGRMQGLATLLGDGDTGWHIRTGEWILAHHAVPARDLFSFSKRGDPWFAWEWLSDMLFASLNSIGGLGAVSVFCVLLLSITFVLLFRLVRRRANAIVAIAITIWTTVATSIHWLARPHLFTFLFLVLFLIALERIREGHTRVAGVPFAIVLSLTTIIWTNLHGGFFVGIVLIAAYGVGELLPAMFLSGATLRVTWSKVNVYFASTLACFLASFVNPYFYHLHVHLIEYLRDPHTAQITEFMTLNFRHPTAIFFEAMLLLAPMVIVWNLVRGRFTEAVVLLLWAHGALIAGRNISIFMLVAAPLAAASVEEWLERLSRANVAAWLRRAVTAFRTAAAGTGEVEAVGRWHLLSVAGMVLVVLLICAPNPPRRFRAEFDPESFPAHALKVLRSAPSARIFTNDQWGDYLIWSLYPAQQVFVDGRSDFYGTAFGGEYLDILSVSYNWEKILGRYGVDTILMPATAPLTGALKESIRWKLVYDDGGAVIFRLADPRRRTPVS